WFWKCPRMNWSVPPRCCGTQWSTWSSWRCRWWWTWRPVPTGSIRSRFPWRGPLMPELPEVETVRRQLEAELVGRVIKGVRVLLPRILKNASPAELAERLIGRRLAAVERRGKFLLLQLDDGASLIVHLRMTGRLT